MDLRAARRDRAKRSGAELFLLDRAFEDCLDRLSLIRQRFEYALLVGCPDPVGALVCSSLPMPSMSPIRASLFAHAADGGACCGGPGGPIKDVRIVLAIGTLDTVNDLPRALIPVRWH